MSFNIRQIDLGKLNSIAKYPSILTYHTLGDKGMLQETVQIPFEVGSSAPRRWTARTPA